MTAKVRQLSDEIILLNLKMRGPKLPIIATKKSLKVDDVKGNIFIP